MPALSFWEGRRCQIAGGRIELRGRFDLFFGHSCPCRRRESGQFFLCLRVRLHHAGRYQERHRVFDRNVELYKFVALHVEEKAGRRIWRAGHECRNMLALRKFRGYVSARRL